MLLFAIKLLHSLILLYLLTCVGLIWHYGLTGQYEQWLWLAIGSVLLEGIIWLAYGMRCPLTEWAVALGDETGADLLSDLIFPEPVNNMPAYVICFMIGIFAAGARALFTEKLQIFTQVTD